MNRHVVFFDDTAVVGGHQISAVAAARLLARDMRVTFIVSESNGRLTELLEEAGVPIARVAAPPRLHAIKAIVHGGGVGEVRRLLRELQATVVVAVQGNILLSTRAIQAARRERIRVISFIPMAMGRAVTPRDRVWAAVARFYYARADAFITTSKNAMRALQGSGVRAPIHLAYYGPDLSAMPHIDRRAARAPLNLRDDEFTIAMIGRVVFSHKGHDVMLRALARDELGDARLLVAGDGPDDARFDALARELGVAARVTRVAWSSDIARVYAAADLIALPSRFEGLPLVMLEAMACERPIAASAVDGMLEVLPPDWLFPAEDVDEFVRTIEHLRHDDVRDAIAHNRRLIEEEMNVEAFAGAFARALP